MEDRKDTGEWEDGGPGSLESLLRSVATEEASEAVKPFLADRVMRRLAPERRSARRSVEEDIAQAMAWFFRRLALGCLFIVCALAGYNLYLSSQYAETASVVESVLALPDVTTASVFDLEMTVEEEPAP